MGLVVRHGVPLRRSPKGLFRHGVPTHVTVVVLPHPGEGQTDQMAKTNGKTPRRCDQ